MSDSVNHPSHYLADSGIEVIDAIEAWKLGFNLGNTVKYIARADHKGDRLENLQKAKWYLEREIQNEGKSRDEPKESGLAVEMRISRRLFLSLHTAQPPASSDHQSSHELSYPGYTRAALENSIWRVVDGVASNARDIEFPRLPPGVHAAVTNIGIGTAETGAGKLLFDCEFYSGVLFLACIVPVISPGGVRIKAELLGLDD